MNRKEAIEVLKTNRSFYRDWKQKEFEEAIETLEKEITLTEFLCWEEGKEYERIHYRYKIENEKLYAKNDYCNWFESGLEINFYKELRKATPVKKKAYHVKDEYSYDCLIKELEEQGFKWVNGIKPASLKVNPFIFSSQDIYVFCIDDRMTWSNSCDSEKYDITEYHKEEPKFRARIKEELNIPLLARDYYFVKASKEIKTAKSGKSPNTREATFIMTKDEWNKLGINDTNADFEEVE